MGSREGAGAFRPLKPAKMERPLGPEIYDPKQLPLQRYGGIGRSRDLLSSPKL
jgi:hypothetical protein